MPIAPRCSSDIASVAAVVLCRIVQRAYISQTTVDQYRIQQEVRDSDILSPFGCFGLSGILSLVHLLRLRGQLRFLQVNHETSPISTALSSTISAKQR